MSLTGATASVLAFHVFESEYPATELFFFLCKKKTETKTRNRTSNRLSEHDGSVRRAQTMTFATSAIVQADTNTQCLRLSIRVISMTSWQRYVHFVLCLMSRAITHHNWPCGCHHHETLLQQFTDDTETVLLGLRVYSHKDAPVKIAGQLRRGQLMRWKKLD